MTGAERMALWKLLTDAERRAVLELRDEAVRQGRKVSCWELVEQLYGNTNQEKAA